MAAQRRTARGERLPRVPGGFPRDHPAAEYLKHRQFLAGREFPASFAASPAFYRGALDVFRHVAPLIWFLNQPLLKDVERKGVRERGDV